MTAFAQSSGTRPMLTSRLSKPTQQQLHPHSGTPSYSIFRSNIALLTYVMSSLPYLFRTVLTSSPPVPILTFLTTSPPTSYFRVPSPPPTNFPDLFGVTHFTKTSSLLRQSKGYHISVLFSLSFSFILFPRSRFAFVLIISIILFTFYLGLHILHSTPFITNF